MESKRIELNVGKTCRISFASSWGTHNEDVCGDEISHFSYSIIYELDGGTLEIPNPALYSVSENSIVLNNPIKEGFEFVGWTGSNGDVPQIHVEIEPYSTGNKTYYARWELADTENPTYVINVGTTGIIKSKNLL